MISFFWWKVYEELEKKDPSVFYEENLCLGKPGSGLGCSSSESSVPKQGGSWKMFKPWQYDVSVFELFPPAFKRKFMHVPLKYLSQSGTQSKDKNKLN